MRLQLLPFHCSTADPTAQMLFAETAAMPNNKLVPLVFGFGLGTTLQFAPFQCWMVASVSEGGCPVPPPAAQTLLGESTATPWSEEC